MNMLMSTQKSLCLVVFLALLTVGWGPASAKDVSGSYAGDAFNVNVGVRAQVTFTIMKDKNNFYGITGSFDNKNLVGKFELFGRTLDQCTKGFVCMQFTGAIKIGGMGGWPAGAQTTFVITLSIDQGTGMVLGTYHIGSLPGNDFEQYGVINARLSK